ncbi:unannotated protein [freshwater metagenome]|uniref:Unannotated protein n=1 Tax=freshwater metagenome TaxID=449393 RepID=A0A6J6E8L7_9ZZZZ
MTVDFSTWIPGWFSLSAVVIYGTVLISLAIRAKLARENYDLRILVTGTRGKSGTVRLIHSGLVNSGIRAFGKVTGTTAVELLPDASEVSTSRLGTAGISEMPQAVRRGAKAGATHGVFECMAISPKLIHIVQAKYVQAQVVVIPTIRLDHLEDEGLTEFEIGMNILNSIDKCQYLVTGVDQPELVEAYSSWCNERDVTFIHCSPEQETPLVPGHHPVNVAVAQEVLAIAGMDNAQATKGIQLAGLEPRALDIFKLDLAGTECLMIDIGGANDPTSSSEALQSWQLGTEAIIPVLVNRWERPLRSVVFSAAMANHFPVTLVTGPLFSWIGRRSTRKLFQDNQNVKVFGAQFVQVSYLDCLRPERIVQKLRQKFPDLIQQRVIFVLVENVHGTKADLLRSNFERGQKLKYSEVLGK